MTAPSATALPYHCVVDASVGIKLFVAEDLSDHAHALFAQLAHDPPAQLHVPDLFYIECANILWKYVRRLGYPADQARQDLRDLGALTLQRTPVTDLMSEALDLALAHGITAYDGSYVALAQRLGMPLVTADEPLTQALSGTGSDIRRLRDLPISSPPP
jgi:predicted nucleic acid-binding protein